MQRGDRDASRESDGGGLGYKDGRQEGRNMNGIALVMTVAQIILE